MCTNSTVSKGDRGKNNNKNMATEFSDTAHMARGEERGTDAAAKVGGRRVGWMRNGSGRCSYGSQSDREMASWAKLMSRNVKVRWMYKMMIAVDV